MIYTYTYIYVQWCNVFVYVDVFFNVLIMNRYIRDAFISYDVSRPCRSGGYDDPGESLVCRVLSI